MGGGTVKAGCVGVTGSVRLGRTVGFAGGVSAGGSVGDAGRVGAGSVGDAGSGIYNDWIGGVFSCSLLLIREQVS